MTKLIALYKKWRQLRRAYSPIFSVIEIAVIFGIFWAYSYELLDPDFGWHLAAGNYIRQHWIPAHDIYTYTARNYRWIDHEWGNDVITSYLYQLGGYLLTSAVFAGIWTASLCLFRRRLRFILLLLAVVAVLPYAGIRPTTWTVFCLAILLQLASRATKRTLIAIPFLLLAWANLHGGFIIGLVLLVYYYLKDRRPIWLIVLLMSILATFVNPYGPRLYVEVAHTLFDPALHTQITEWRSFYLEPTGWLFIGLWLVGFWLYDKQHKNRWFSVTPLLILASLSASRNLPLFIVGSLRDIDRYSSYLKLPKDLDRPRKLLIAAFVTFIVAIVSYCLLASLLPWTNRFISYPVPEISYLQEHTCPGNIFNDYNYGGYLIWQLPSVPVYIDGRMPTWHDPSGHMYLNRYLAILYSKKTQQTEFRRYNIRCALLANTNEDKRLRKSLEQQGWVVVSSGNEAQLLIAPAK